MAPDEQFTLWDRRHKQGEEIDLLAKFGFSHWTVIAWAYEMV